jgi:hypothetical protein
VAAVPLDRSWRRLRKRVLKPSIIIGVVALLAGVAVAPILAGHSLGPRSSAAIALVVFGGMLGTVLVRRYRSAKHLAGEHQDVTVDR